MCHGKKTVHSRAVRHSTAQAPEIKTLHQASFDFQKIKNGEKLVVDNAIKGFYLNKVDVGIKFNTLSY